MAKVKLEIRDVPFTTEKLGMFIEGDVWVVPRMFEDFIKKMNIRSALQLMSALQVFPSGAAEVCGVTPQEVLCVAKEINSALKEIDPIEFSDELWEPKKRPPMGARLPDKWLGKTAGEIKNMD